MTMQYENGGRQSYRIVGIDEADPAKGLISYVAPLARALLGKRVGDGVEADKQGLAEIVAIDHGDNARRPLTWVPSRRPKQFLLPLFSSGRPSS